VIPILSSNAMRKADAQAVAARGVEALVAAAGTAVALHAKRMLGTCYGRQVAVVVGPGLNGADGSIAATWLITRGAHVDVIEWDHAPRELDGFDLVIDAAFGLGCSRPYVAPPVSSGTLVLAVDLPSGVDADTGALLGEPMRADATVALGAFKPAHFSGPAAELRGELLFAGLGIVSDASDALIEDNDLASLVTYRHGDNKWDHALQAYVGSTLMPGAAELVLRGALAGGASMIRFESRGDVASSVELPPEVVHVNEPEVDRRCRAVVAGPGLGADASSWLRDRLHDAPCPVVLDADGLDRKLIDDLSPRNGSWVLTPHEGEFVRLTGGPLGANRFDDVRALAQATGCVVLLKGPTTVIAAPSGTLRVVTSGTSALATAGTGDVLSGLIGAAIARGHDPLDAAALSAHLHGGAGSHLSPYSSASDVVSEVRRLIRELTSVPERTSATSTTSP
jgi:ADP-dependent NAD(P)H-hydrate dehydratase / NAD(P)H-hydrate epimerase